MQFDHIGVVVKNTDETMDTFVKLFGFEVEEVQTFADQGFKSTIAAKDEVRIELIEPIGKEGIIHNFVQKNGYGLHHISLRVDDLEEEISMMEGKGVKMINKKPVPITELSEIAFIHPTSAAGILIEMINRKTA